LIWDDCSSAEAPRLAHHARNHVRDDGFVHIFHAEATATPAPGAAEQRPRGADLLHHAAGTEQAQALDIVILLERRLGDDILSCCQACYCECHGQAAAASRPPHCGRTCWRRNAFCRTALTNLPLALQSAVAATVTLKVALFVQAGHLILQCQSQWQLP